MPDNNENPSVSSGKFLFRRYHLPTSETVHFSDTLAQQYDVGPVVNMAAAQGRDNPCRDCGTLIDLVRQLASRNGIEPEAMGQLTVDCHPEGETAETYKATGMLPDGISAELTHISCALIQWIVDTMPRRRPPSQPE